MPKISGQEDIEATGSKKVPDVVKRAFKYASEIKSEEQLLWRLVSARAVLDCVGETGFGPSCHKKHMAAVIDAQRFFRKHWDEARVIFDVAGVEIDGVREALSEYHIDSNDKVVRIAKGKRHEQPVHKAERSRVGAC